MQDERETEADLIFDVQMALRGAPLRKDADKGVLARRIVEHLKLCRWVWRRKEPEVWDGRFTKGDT